MLAIAAFLIILVILFGLENVREFFFGTLGIFGVVLAAFFIFGFGALALAKFGEILKKRKQAKKEGKKPEDGDLLFTFLFWIVVCVLIVVVYRAIFP